MKAINLARRMGQFSSHWNPHVVANYNENDGMVVRFEGVFPYHLHETADDFLLVLPGEMTVDLEGASHIVRAGEMFVVPKDVTHRPRAESECHVLLIEPKGEPNTGDPRTAAFEARI